jgi:hypothetical protein
MTSRKSGVYKKVVHYVLPSSWGLLNTIKRFIKEINKVGVILDIVERFFHVDLFLHIPMQEGSLVHIVKIPTFYLRCYGQKCPYCHKIEEIYK